MLEIGVIASFLRLGQMLAPETGPAVPYYRDRPASALLLTTNAA